MAEGMNFPWGLVLGQLLLGLLYGFILWIAVTILLELTIRRSLMGCILAAKVKTRLAEYGIILPVAVFALGIWLLTQHLFSGGGLLIAAAAILAVFFLTGMFPELAINSRLSDQLWIKRREIEKYQEEIAKQQPGIIVRVHEGQKAEMTPEEKGIYEKINLRLLVENMRKKYYDKTSELVETAARDLQTSGVAFDHGAMVAMTAIFFEGVCAYIFALSGSYLAIGLNLTSQAGVSWTIPALVSAGVGLAALPLLMYIKKRRNAWECLYCGKRTTRIVHRGEFIFHLCSDACEKKLKALMRKI
jgi:hypothetical protein